MNLTKSFKAYLFSTLCSSFEMELATKPISLFAKQLVFFLLLLSSCNKPYTADEGKKMLIAADREIARSMSRLMETQAFAAMSRLNDLDQVPLPMRYFQPEDDSTIQTYFDYARHAGLFKENSRGKLELIRPSDSLIIDYIFHQQTGKRAVFILENYQESTTAFGNQMPVSAKACILLDGRKIMEISHKASLKHGIPVEMHVQLRMNHLWLNIDSRIKLGKKSGNLKLNASLRDSEQELLNAEIRSKLGFSEHQSLYFGSKTLKINVFPLQFYMKSDYPFDGMPLATLIDDFNRLSQMNLTDQSGRAIGNLKLAFIPEMDQISFMMNFPDGSQSNLEESMSSVRRILNIKIGMHGFVGR
jgi:hypothetical protein